MFSEERKKGFVVFFFVCVKLFPELNIHRRVHHNKCIIIEFVLASR